MKVFQVIIEYSKDGSKEIIERMQYVTHENNSLSDVASYFSIQCDELDEELKSVREVLTICERVLANKEQT